MNRSPRVDLKINVPLQNEQKQTDTDVKEGKKRCVPAEYKFQSFSTWGEERERRKAHRSTPTCAPRTTRGTKPEGSSFSKGTKKTMRSFFAGAKTASISICLCCTNRMMLSG